MLICPSATALICPHPNSLTQAYNSNGQFQPSSLWGWNSGMCQNSTCNALSFGQQSRVPYSSMPLSILLHIPSPVTPSLQVQVFSLLPPRAVLWRDTLPLCSLAASVLGTHPVPSVTTEHCICFCAASLASQNWGSSLQKRGRLPGIVLQSPGIQWGPTMVPLSLQQCLGAD